MPGRNRPLRCGLAFLATLALATVAAKPVTGQPDPQRQYLVALVWLLLVPGGLLGNVVTCRLGTGLSGSESEGSLPEAWVAPADTATTIDGRLDDRTWQATRPFVLGDLLVRRQATPQTEVWLVRHASVLYVGVRCDEPNLQGLKRSVAQKDGPAYNDDSIELFLSPDPSQGYYQIILGAGGAVFDRMGHGDPATWDSRAEMAVAVNADAWSLEAAIPISALGVRDVLPARWRANVYRNRRAGGTSESQAFSPTLRSDYDVPERFGRLLFAPKLPWAAQEAAQQEQQAIKIESLEGGRWRLRFDLSRLPGGAKIHRARLLCERRAPDPADPSPPGPAIIVADGSNKPLELVAPWYRSFDATEAVSGWLAGRGEPVLHVASFPGWRVESTRLDVMYEGQPADVPAQAADLKAFHRSGQTFLTWQEIDDPIGKDEIRWGELKSILGDLQRGREIRYCIYRSDQPITAATIHQVEPIAVVKPLSGWNINGRTIERPIDEFIATADELRHHQWNPFRDAAIDGDYGRDCRMDRFVIEAGKPALKRRTGLYVHTAHGSTKAYYAVVTCIDGVENTLDFGPGNSLARPVGEEAAEPEPVLQGELPGMPFFNYKQRRLHYVRWVGPPHANVPYAYYNWSVGVPDELGRGVALELNLHRDGYGYWRTHYRIEPESIVLCPHDFPVKTWWYGYHEAAGTLRPWTDGAIHNYTERRLLAFIDWAVRKWPVDRNRILVTGCNGGASGSGALHLGLRYPDVFNLVIAGHGEADYRAFGDQPHAVWGRVDWALKTESGRTIWDELDLVRHVQSLPPNTELPLVTMTFSGNQKTAGALTKVLADARQPLLFYTMWGGTRYLAVSATSTAGAIRVDIRKDLPLLAVHQAPSDGDAVHNASLLWRAEGLVDQPDRFQVTIDETRVPFSGTVTLRRLQRFKVQPGRTCQWTLEPLLAADVSVANAPQPQGGQVVAGDDELLSIGLSGVRPGTYRLTVEPK